MLHIKSDFSSEKNIFFKSTDWSPTLAERATVNLDCSNLALIVYLHLANLPPPLSLPHPKNLHMKFEFNWHSGFRENENVNDCMEDNRWTSESLVYY